MKRWPFALAQATGVIGLAAVFYWWFVVSRPDQPTAASVPPSRISNVARPVAQLLTVQLDSEGLRRAEIQTAQAKLENIATEIRAPGTVEPNQYRSIVVSSVVGGTVVEVPARLGDSVRRGETLARIFSKTIAEAQRAYVSAAAMVEADHKKLMRTQKLVEIGAASRQELETVGAEHEAHASELESIRKTLLQLGVSENAITKLKSPADINAYVSVSAPISGTVLERKINQGQVIAEGMELFQIADLSSVWAIAEIYEQNFKDVRLRASARITTVAYPNREFVGKVTYIDPSVNPETRTSRARVEVPNPSGLLRLKMFVEIVFAGRTVQVVAVPEEAVQFIGEHSVVYQSDGRVKGKFVQKPVELGARGNGLYQILSGIQPGNTVVTKGSFLLRSESLRINPQQ